MTATANSAPLPLGTSVDELCRRAREAHPDIQSDDDSFSRHLLSHASEIESDRVDSLRVEDLYVAWASVRQDPAALRMLESMLAQVPAALRRINGSATFAQDVQQLLREKLLIGTAQTGPKLAQYAGRGPLAGWVRTAALRTALNMVGATREQALGDRDLADNISAPDPHSNLIRERYRADFEAAISDAFRYLTARERNILRLSYLDGLSIDRIGAVFGVHRATTARWLQRAREKLQEATRRLLQERLRVTDSEFGSLVRVLKSQLHVSLPGLLGRSSRSASCP